MIVTHLTRMASPYICVAGVKASPGGTKISGEHVRPVLSSGERLHMDLLSKFALGAVVDLGATEYIGSHPETEDYTFEPVSAQALSHISQEQFWKIVKANSKSSLRAIFGTCLQQRSIRQGTGAIVNRATGQASLGEFQASKVP
jgi:hypothetical protein